jgi:hypothetical protein
MNKRGQFYLVAAIVIVALIVGFTTIQNYTSKEESTKVYDLGEELGIEGNQVLEYGLVNLAQGTSSSENEFVSISSLFDHFTSKYSTYISDQSINIYFIFGNETSISVVSYNELSGTFSLGGVTTEINQATSVQEIVPEDGKILVTIDSSEHEFDLQPGENFYYIISQENLDGSVNIVTSEN